MVIMRSNGVAESLQNGGDDFSPQTESVDGDPVVMPPSSSDTSDLDSGMESDEHDITSFIEPGTELCQVGNRTLALPTDLCELPNLSGILSIDTWNDLLSDSDRFELAKYLPDMDEATFVDTLVELLQGANFNFGSPMMQFFEQLKGGQLDPRVVLYRKGMNFVQKRGYYCNLRNYQDSMVGRILSIKEAMQNCDESYGVEERIRFVNIIRNQESLGNESDESTELEIETESGYKSESEFENSDSDNTFEFDKFNLGKDFVNGGFREKSANKFPKRRNSNLGLAKIGKSGGRSIQFDDGLHKSLGKMKSRLEFGSMNKPCKNKKNSNSKLKGPKGKSGSKQNWTNGDGINLPSPELNNSPNKSEETESDLSPKLRATEPEKPKKLVKKEKEKEKTVKMEKKAKMEKKKKMEKKDKMEKKVIPRGRKGGRKRKPENVNVAINSINGNDNDNNNNIPKLETIENDNNLVEIPILQEGEKPLKRRKKKTPISGTEDTTKKRKRKEPAKVEQTEESTVKKTKRVRKKPETVPVEPVPPVPVLVSTEAVKEEEVIVPVVEPAKKAYVPIKPSIHKDFSFSLIHLLSSVRKALLNATNDNNNDDGTNVPVSVKEIAERVISDPLDPSILTAQEPLNDLIRGVLKILSSKQAPLGIKSWKPLVFYSSSNKSYYWTGPVTQPITGEDPPNGEDSSSTTPDSWGLPHKSLVKLVDSFANWLKQGEETLKKLGGLGLPPVAIHANLDEKDRFKDIKSLKSQFTIPPSSLETKSYFQKEESIRYSIPDRAFFYTATDGRKSTVAPLSRASGKKASKKARDHFMLKSDRPPHVTILCLVRDAASRLPGSIGTRADVCTLIRDSQFVVDDVSDEKISEVVSGALDRLHYQEDPCVRFDSERKLWVYLHREREEEDFEDDANSSTKRWKKPATKKEEDEGADLDAPPVVVAENIGHDDGSEDVVGIQTGQENLFGLRMNETGQTGQENLFGLRMDETGHAGQENLFGLRVEEMGQAGRENLFGLRIDETGQAGRENLFGLEMNETGGAGQGNGELVGQFGGQRRVGFFNASLL